MTTPSNADGGNEHSVANGWNVVDHKFLRHPPPGVAGLAICVGAIIALLIVLAAATILGQFLWQAVTVPSQGLEDTSKRLIAIGIVVAAPFAIWRIIVSHWQARAAQAQARAANHQAEVAREEHYTSLFTAAVGQLGAVREVSEDGKSRTEPNVEARLGAIYALERIAQDSERDHWPIMETLSAYIRNAAGPAQSPSSEVKENVIEHYASGEDYGTPVRVDVQAALTVIGRRKPERLRHERELRDSALGSNSYRLDFRRANLSKVVLDGLQFDYAVFDDSDLSFASMKNTSLVNASLHRVSAVGAECWGAKMTRARVSGEWQGAGLRSADLSTLAINYGRSNFDGAYFTDANLSGSRLTHWSLIKASFPRAKLMATQFDNCTLVGTSFYDANLTDAKINGRTWVSVDVSGANLGSTEGISQGFIDASYGNGATTLPTGLTRPAAWLPKGSSDDVAHKYRMDAYDHRLASIAEWRAEKKKSLDDDIPF